MSEIEKAIERFESFIKYCQENPNASKLVDDFDLHNDKLALQALKEKEERDKGCEVCKGITSGKDFIITNYGQKSEKRLDSKYCTECGRKLGE